MSKGNIKIKKVQSSEIGQAKCVNCGRRWGQHLGIDCPHGETCFEPEGFSLDDECGNCGGLLINHRDRAICVEREDTIFERVNGIFSDEDFIL